MRFYLTLLRNKDEKLLLPRLIMDVEKTNYNHIEILAVYNNPAPHLVPDVALSFGAVFPKSRWCTEERLKRTYEEIERIPLNVKIPDGEAIDILFKHVGKPYSVAQLVIIYVKIFLTKYLSWLPFVKLNLTDRLICTEIAGNFMKEACKYKIDISTEALRLVEATQIARQAIIDEESNKLQN